MVSQAEGQHTGRVVLDISTAFVEQAEKSRRHVTDREGFDVVPERSPRIRAVVVEKSSSGGPNVSIFRFLRIVEEITRGPETPALGKVDETAMSINLATNALVDKNVELPLLSFNKFFFLLRGCYLDLRHQGKTHHHKKPDSGLRTYMMIAPLLCVAHLSATLFRTSLRRPSATVRLMPVPPPEARATRLRRTRIQE